MSVSTQVKQVLSQITAADTKLGDLKKLAAKIKRDHELASELWKTKQYFPRMLAVLILDKAQLSEKDIQNLATDMLQHEESECTQLADWMMANQLTKNKKQTLLLEQWESHPSAVLRRLFWYHQARLRWMGKTPPDNSESLLTSLEKNMASAEPIVQWAMNFCAGQIGIHEPAYRSRCIKLGEKLALYKDDIVAKNCTPSYLPEFIRIEVAKRELNK